METSTSMNGAILRKVEFSPAFKDGASRFAGSIPAGTTFVFDIGSLTAKNPSTLKCDSGEAVAPSSIIGCMVTVSYTADTDLVFVFDGRISLSVSLREEDYIGPEAAVFRSATGEVVVFDWKHKPGNINSVE